jgi:PKD repeat protein
MGRCVFFLLLLAACSGQGPLAVDARPNNPSPDAAPRPDTGPLSVTVDFTVANCPQVDSILPSCSGTAPFTVQFVPITTPNVSTYVWNFGDGTGDDTSSAPLHTFYFPGSFSVMLGSQGEQGEWVSRTRSGFINVSPPAMGGPCQDDLQCDLNLFCLCSNADRCTTGPLTGMCTSSCKMTVCPKKQVCANLASTPTSDNAEPWQAQICLPECGSDGDCRPGLKCRTLPAWPNSLSWVHGCFTDEPADLGGSCMDAAGSHRNDLCVSGLCANLGALGLCSRDCSNALCAVGSDCAVFGDGRELCLVPCSASFPCDQDPLLTCVAPGFSPLGYQLKNLPSRATGTAFCAPKPCSSNTDCGAAGLCNLGSAGGHCVARPR